MKIEYQYTFGLPRKIVWKYIKDVKILKKAIPNCKSFTEPSSGVYQGEIEMNFGPIRDILQLEIRIVKEKPPSFFHLLVRGKGDLGEIYGTANILINAHPGGALVTIQADADLKGALLTAAQKVLDVGSQKGLELFFEKMEKEIKYSLYQIRRKK